MINPSPTTWWPAGWPHPAPVNHALHLLALKVRPDYYNYGWIFPCVAKYVSNAVIALEITEPTPEILLAVIQTINPADVRIVVQNAARNYQERRMMGTA